MTHLSKPTVPHTSFGWFHKLSAQQLPLNRIPVNFLSHPPERQHLVQTVISISVKMDNEREYGILTESANVWHSTINKLLFITSSYGLDIRYEENQFICFAVVGGNSILWKINLLFLASLVSLGAIAQKVIVKYSFGTIIHYRETE